MQLTREKIFGSGTAVLGYNYLSAFRLRFKRSGEILIMQSFTLLEITGIFSVLCKFITRFTYETGRRNCNVYHYKPFVFKLCSRIRIRSTCFSVKIFCYLQAKSFTTICKLIVHLNIYWQQPRNPLFFHKCWSKISIL